MQLIFIAGIISEDQRKCRWRLHIFKTICFLIQETIVWYNLEMWRTSVQTNRNPLVCTISVCCRFGQLTTKPNSCVLMSWMQQALLLWQKGGPGSEGESFRGPFESLWTMHLRQCWTMQNGLVILGFISICCLQGAHSLWRPGIAAAAAPDIVYIIVFVKWFICGFPDICLGFQSLFLEHTSLNNWFKVVLERQQAHEPPSVGKLVELDLLTCLEAIWSYLRFDLKQLKAPPVLTSQM